MIERRPMIDDEIPCQRTEEIPLCHSCGGTVDVERCPICKGAVCVDCMDDELGNPWICPDCARDIRKQAKARAAAHPDELRVRRQEESEIAALGLED